MLRAHKEILIAAPSVAEYLRFNASDTLPPLPKRQGVTVVAFDERAARDVAGRFAESAITTFSRTDGVPKNYIRYDVLIVACAVAHSADYLVTEVRKERGVYFVLRENGAGADRALDQLAEEMAALQVERMCFKRSLVRNFHRVGSYLGLFLGPLLLILLYLDRFERVRLALTSVLLISLLVDIYVGRIRLKQEAREAAILDRFRFFQSIVHTVPNQNGEKP